MRVALVAETFLPAVNGVVNSVLRAAEQLVERGHEPLVIAPRGPADHFTTRSGRQVEIVGVPAMPVPMYQELRVARPALDLQPVLADLSPDVVHLASPLVLGWSAAHAARELGIPCVAVYQTDLSGFLRRYRLNCLTPGIWTMLRRLHNQTDLTLVPSSSSAFQLRAQGIGPLAVWARGVDGARFNPSQRSELLHAQLGGVGSLVVGFVGRLAAEKRVEMLEPLSRLAGVQLVVIGDGPRRAKLERAMPQARFLGLRTGRDLARLMASMDLLVSPGRDETFCQVVQEGLASGVPVVTAAAGGPLDLVRHGDNGWLWSGQDPAVLAALVDSLRGDRTLLRAVARRARPSVIERSWSAIGDQLIGHYESVMAGDRRPESGTSEKVVPLRTRRLWRRAS